MNADDYIFFEDLPGVPERKTRVAAVVNRSSGFTLGQIRWYGAWRQYCFTPSPVGQVIFNVDCMKRIADECQAMTAAHREARK